MLSQDSFKAYRKGKWIEFAILGLAIGMLVTAATALASQPPGLRGPNSYSVGVGTTIDGKTEYGQILWSFYPEYRGLFAIEVYDLIQWDENAKIWIPAPIPANSTISFYQEPNRIYAGLEKNLIGYHAHAESRFVGRVWLRREVLWVLFVLACLATLCTGARSAATVRQLRRSKKGLCIRCAYPLPLEDEEPRCPECGSIHTP